jgi:hypothetical protein
MVYCVSWWLLVNLNVSWISLTNRQTHQLTNYLTIKSTKKPINQVTDRITNCQYLHDQATNQHHYLCRPLSTARVQKSVRLWWAEHVDCVKEKCTQKFGRKIHSEKRAWMTEKMEGCLQDHFEGDWIGRAGGARRFLSIMLSDRLFY